MSELPNGPLLWGALLDAINFPGAVVAGGCIRDWCLSIEPKDIDICLPISSATELSEFCDSIDGKAGIVIEEYPDDYEEGEDPVLIGVARGQAFGYNVDFIARSAHIEGPQALIDSFDFDILQAYWTRKSEGRSGGGQFFWNPCQAIALQRQVATLAHDKHIEQSIARFMRFNNRHPGLLSLNIPFGT